MGSPYTVQVHQNTNEPSIKSAYSYSSGSYASSGASTPRSYSPGEYREYSAANHTVQVSRSGRNTIVAHNQTSYDDAPHPSYTGAYARQ